MSKIYLIGLDGSDASSRAVYFALAQAQQTGAHLVLAHVIDWSGYDVMGPEEIAIRHSVRDEEIKAAHKNILDPVLVRLTESGVASEGIVHHGHATSILLEIAKEKSVDHIFVGRHGQSRIEAMLFGSTTNAMVQTSPVPVTVVP